MFLQNIALYNFKNYPALESGFSSRINCFTGNNGVGKTNILDAIYYLSFGKSYFTSSDHLIVSHGTPAMLIQGTYQHTNTTESIICSYENGKRKIISRNKVEYTRIADHIGLIPLIMVAPADIFLIIGNSEDRRKFIDSIISQYNREYLYQLQRYNKVLTQRNLLLKSPDNHRNNTELLSIYDEQLAQSAQFLYSERNKFIETFIPVFQDIYQKISNQNEQVALRYQSTLHASPLLSQLQTSIQTDYAARHTTCGIHKDDLELLIDQYPIRKLGSQGQQKSYLVALKLAQYAYIKSQCGFNPILLLDDVFDKLDNNRVTNIVELVTTPSFGQIFITDTNYDRIHGIMSKIELPYLHFNVSDSKLTLLHEIH